MMIDYVLGTEVLEIGKRLFPAAVHPDVDVPALAAERVRIISSRPLPLEHAGPLAVRYERFVYLRSSRDVLPVGPGKFLGIQRPLGIDTEGRALIPGNGIQHAERHSQQGLLTGHLESLLPVFGGKAGRRGSGTAHCVSEEFKIFLRGHDVRNGFSFCKAGRR